MSWGSRLHCFLQFAPDSCHSQRVMNTEEKYELAITCLKRIAGNPNNVTGGVVMWKDAKNTLFDLGESNQRVVFDQYDGVKVID